MCDAFRDLGPRTFRCAVPGAHTLHKGISGTEVNFWQDGAPGAMGQHNPRASDPLPTTVAPDYLTQPYEGHPKEPLPIPGIGPVGHPYGQPPYVQLAISGVPTDPPLGAGGQEGPVAPVPKVQPPYVQPVSHDAT